MAFKTSVAPVPSAGKISPRSLGYSLQPGAVLTQRPLPIISTIGTSHSPTTSGTLTGTLGGASPPSGWNNVGPGMTVATYQPVSTSPSPVGPATNKLSGLIHGLFA